jgi:carbohydrate-binding DOMON domain-containing protein
MSTQYRLVQSGKTANGGCSAGQGSSEPVAPRIYFLLHDKKKEMLFSTWLRKRSLTRLGYFCLLQHIFLSSQELG